MSPHFKKKFIKKFPLFVVLSLSFLLLPFLNSSHPTSKHNTLAQQKFAKQGSETEYLPVGFSGEQRQEELVKRFLKLEPLLHRANFFRTFFQFGTSSLLVDGVFFGIDAESQSLFFHPSGDPQRRYLSFEVLTKPLTALTPQEEEIIFTLTSQEIFTLLKTYIESEEQHLLIQYQENPGVFANKPKWQLAVFITALHRLARSTYFAELGSDSPQFLTHVSFEDGQKIALPQPINLYQPFRFADTLVFYEWFASLTWTQRFTLLNIARRSTIKNASFQLDSKKEYTFHQSLVVSANDWREFRLKLFFVPKASAESFFENEVFLPKHSPYLAQMIKALNKGRKNKALPDSVIGNVVDLSSSVEESLSVYEPAGVKDIDKSTEIEDYWALYNPDRNDETELSMTMRNLISFERSKFFFSTKETVFLKALKSRFAKVWDWYRDYRLYLDYLEQHSLQLSAQEGTRTFSLAEFDELVRSILKKGEKAEQQLVLDWGKFVDAYFSKQTVATFAKIVSQLGVLLDTDLTTFKSSITASIKSELLQVWSDLHLQATRFAPVHLSFLTHDWQNQPLASPIKIAKMANQVSELSLTNLQTLALIARVGSTVTDSGKEISESALELVATTGSTTSAAFINSLNHFWQSTWDVVRPLLYRFPFLKTLTYEYYPGKSFTVNLKSLTASTSTVGFDHALDYYSQEALLPQTPGELSGRLLAELNKLKVVASLGVSEVETMFVKRFAEISSQYWSVLQSFINQRATSWELSRLTHDQSGVVLSANQVIDLEKLFAEIKEGEITSVGEFKKLFASIYTRTQGQLSVSAFESALVRIFQNTFNHFHSETWSTFQTLVDKYGQFVPTLTHDWNHKEMVSELKLSQFQSAGSSVDLPLFFTKLKSFDSRFRSFLIEQMFLKSFVKQEQTEFLWYGLKVFLEKYLVSGVISQLNYDETGKIVSSPEAIRLDRFFQANRSIPETLVSVDAETSSTEEVFLTTNLDSQALFELMKLSAKGLEKVEKMFEFSINNKFQSLWTAFQTNFQKYRQFLTKLGYDATGEFLSKAVSLDLFTSDVDQKRQPFNLSEPAFNFMVSLSSQTGEAVDKMFAYEVDLKFGQLWTFLQERLATVKSLFTSLESDEKKKALVESVQLTTLVKQIKQKTTQLDQQALTELSKLVGKEIVQIGKMFTVAKKSSLLTIFNTIFPTLIKLRYLQSDKPALMIFPVLAQTAKAPLVKEIINKYDVSALIFLEKAQVASDKFTFSPLQEKQLRQLQSKEKLFSEHVETVVLKSKSTVSKTKSNKALVIGSSVAAGFTATFLVGWAIVHFVSSKKG